MSPRPSRRVSHKRRAPREWIGRIALACAITVTGYETVTFSIAQAMVKTQPRTADTLVPYDGRLKAAHAAALMTPDVTAVDRTQAAALSRAALRRDPTAVSAVATLSLIALEQNDLKKARRLLTYAQMLSRRNVQIQLMSIENSVARNDISGTLRWYDIALRTKPALNATLYPVLAQASHDPAIRTAVARTLAGKPAWSDNYVSYVAAQKDDPRSSAALFFDLRARGVAVPASAQALVANLLLEAGDIDQAWRFYSTLRPGAERTQLRDPHFAAGIDAPSMFDWSTLNDGSIAASIQRTSSGGVFEWAAPPSVGGPMLQQVQLLPAGTYRLTGHSDGITQEVRALPYWVLTCRGDGRELGRVIVPNSAQSSGHFSGTLKVPGNCPVQILTFIAQASDAVTGTSGQIDSIWVTPSD